eukprot:CAMPEP_0183717554 /NCGR_PEP_ID=MMETSP0737-20130205/11144_1 /TAXON_ID=385413 /ORGANISM="Thalassiosira miniscula, Strain CCMP1093" /LENGTH=766 /DNA_ID=CAMNT_0025947025 /DNA_START=247 /DNA_END=2547 /DNA_ORIENTATION=-
MRPLPLLTTSSLPLLLLLTLTILLLHQPSPVTATITISTSGKQYHSRPAAFGFKLDYGLQYVALLQIAEDDLHLCAGEEEERSDGLDWEEDRLKLKRDDGSGSSVKIEEDRLKRDGFLENNENINDRALFDEEDTEGWLREEQEERDEARRRLLEVEPMNESPTATLVTNGIHHHRTRGTHSYRHPNTEEKKKTVNVIGDNSNYYWDDDHFEISNVDTTDKTSSKNATQQQKEIHVMPSHGVPVAILAKRGQCTYETKARVASTLTSPHGTVRFVIVYDNVPGDGNHLITMMPEENDAHEGQGGGKDGHELWKEVGLVFVSYESGLDLREFIESQSRHVLLQGGPRVLIDASDHWVFPPMDESAAGLAFLLMLFGCVCSMSLFLNTTLYGGRGSGDSIIMNDHQLFFLGPDGPTAATGGGARNGGNGGSSRRNGGRGNGLRLLTLEEVETLPTMEYCAPDLNDSEGEEGPNNLELRDKSEMPYLADEYDNDNGNADGNQQPQQEEGQLQRDSSLHGIDNEEGVDSPRGGLCEHLLPGKKSDPHFDHNTCSICLDEYELGEQIRVLPCQHTFHSNCIFPWLTERSPTCPLCKAMFEAVQYEEEEEGQQEEGGDASNNAGGEGEAGAGEGAESMPRPPLEDEPPVHRGRSQRQQRRQRQEEAREERAAQRQHRRQRSGRDNNTTAPEANTDVSGEEASPMPSAVNEEEQNLGSGGEEATPSSGSRRRWWRGLFGMAGATATTEAVVSSDNALEEPLLTSDSDDADNIV